jgi:tetratricopeptide (TPR) repeat protein
MTRWLIGLVSCLLGVIIAGAAVFYWRGRVSANQTEMAFAMAQAALDNAEYTRALLIINSRPASDNAEDVGRWADLETAGSVQLGLLDRLESIFHFHPQAVLASEDACILLARTAMHLEQPERADQFADPWRNKSTRPHLWTCFDADRLIRQEQADAARRKLESVKYEGPADCGRLVRLAMLTGRDNLRQAWNHLAAAYEKNPRNAEVRLYRGQILEQADQLGFARVEFEAAHFADTNNPIYLDSLAEFYRRQGNTAGALDVWAQSLDKETAGFIWTKSLFWNRVTRGAELPVYTVTNRSTVYFHFNRYLSDLPNNVFWSDDAFDLLPYKAFISTRQQEAWWLQILDLLRQGKERDALDRLADNPFGNRIWAQPLYVALTRILNFRIYDDINPAKWFPPDSFTISTNGHSFLSDIENIAKKRRVMRDLYQIPQDLEALFKSPDAPAVVLLAGGWFKAGLDLFQTTDWPAKLPDWVPYSVTQAKRLVEGDGKALTYAKKQPATPNLKLLIGETQLTTGELESGQATLLNIATNRTPTGRRAAWLLANTQMQQQQTAAAKLTVSRQPLLGKSVTGRELLARIAMAEKDEAGAIKIYESIVTNSFEAKAVLARLAFEKKDYDRARQLTEELQFAQPDALRFRANLVEIRKAVSQKQN